MRYVLPRQYKDLKPVQQALRQPQAPHHAGLFCFCTLMRPVLPGCGRCMTGAVVNKRLSVRCPDAMMEQLYKKGLP